MTGRTHLRSLGGTKIGLIIIIIIIIYNLAVTMGGGFQKPKCLCCKY